MLNNRYLTHLNERLFMKKILLSLNIILLCNIAASDELIKKIQRESAESLATFHQDICDKHDSIKRASVIAQNLEPLKPANVSAQLKSLQDSLITKNSLLARELEKAISELTDLGKKINALSSIDEIDKEYYDSCSIQKPSDTCLYRQESFVTTRIEKISKKIADNKKQFIEEMGRIIAESSDFNLALAVLKLTNERSLPSDAATSTSEEPSSSEATGVSSGI